MVTNTLQVGGFKGLVGRGVALNDGEFEVLLVRTPKTTRDLHSIASYLFMREGDNECVYQFKAKHLKITSPESVDWTLEQLAEQTQLSKSALGSYEADDFKDISHYALSS